MIAGRFERKLIATYLLLVAAIAFLAGPYILSSLKRASIDQLKTSLQAQARLMSDEMILALVADNLARLQELAHGLAAQVSVRVTVIALDGRVLADSERTFEQIARMDNHLGRPEVRASISEGVGTAIRRSGTTGFEMLYLAIPLRQEGVSIGTLRLGMLLSDVNRNLSRIRQTLLIAAALGLAAAAVLGLLFARRVTRPIADMTAVARRMGQGDFSRRISAPSADEVGQLGQALNTMAQRLEDRLAEFQEERAKGAAILDSMVEGVVAVDEANRILFINASACRLFNAPSVGAEGRPFLEVIRNKEMLDLMQRTLKEGTSARQELEIYTPVHRIAQVHAAPLIGRGRTSGAILVMHDVTALRRLEMVRTEFVANVSHELRTPLTSIRGYLETLLEGGLEDREHARPFLEVIHKHTERMGRLLDDILDLSNIELGRIILHRRPTDLREVVDGVMTIYGPQAAKQEIELQAEVPADLPPALADRDRLAQVLINLLDNSLKFTPKGGRVTVTARRVQSAECGVRSASDITSHVVPRTSHINCVEISVSDTGIGIPSQDLPRITERFYRVDKTRSRELGGTGLGLAIVKHLVEAHGGELVIDSQLNRGTTVRFSLPIAPTDTDCA